MLNSIIFGLISRRARKPLNNEEYYKLKMIKEHDMSLNH